MSTYVFMWIAGAVVVILFGWNKFQEEGPLFRDANRNRVFSQIYLRDLTVHFAFSRALFFYIAILLLMYITIVLAGKRLISFGSVDVPPEVWPLVGALVIANLMPNVPWVSKVELWLRGIMHARAMILRAVDDLYADLRDAEQNWQGLSDVKRKEIFPLVEMEEKFSKGGALSSDATNWFRTAILVNTLEQVMAAPGMARKLGRTFVEKYRSLWDQIFEDFNTIREQLNLEAATSIEEVEKKIKKQGRSINNVCRDAFSFASCAVVNRPHKVSTSDAFKILNFEPTIGPDQPKDPLQKLADSLFFSFFVSLFAVVIAYTLLSVVRDWVGETYPGLKASWPEMASISSNLLSLVLDYGWIGVGIFVFFLFRKWRVSQNHWYVGPEAETRSVTAQNYLMAGGLVLAVALFTLPIFDALVLFVVDRSCESNLSNCFGLLSTKLGYFISRNWLKIAFCVTACVVVFIFFENFSKSNTRVHRARVLIWTLFIVLSFDILRKVNLEVVTLAQAAAKVTLNPSKDFRGGFLVVGAICSIVFWTVFMLRAYVDAARRQPTG
ncbi:hypothetical protein [Mesorhizobium sp. CN2-181]|uniref:hypothetical protein n=1 Tax=Mesorhizobium yinganensis TaxID=3157707 RepID=UPI0032B83CBE